MTDLLPESLSGFDWVGDSGFVACGEVEKKVSCFLEGQDARLCCTIGKLRQLHAWDSYQV